MKKSVCLLFSAICVAAASFGSFAHANPINGASSGIATPATLITFNEFVFAANTPLTNQYAALGVTFSPTLYYSPDDSTNPYPNVDARFAGNYHTVPGEGDQPPSPTSFQIDFTSAQDRASFAMVSNYSPWTFTAFYLGAFVETFTADVVDDSGLFYGFSGVTFDSIHFDGDDYTSIDNIAFGTAGQAGPSVDANPAAVPEPSSVALLGLAALGLAFSRRRKAR